MKTPTKTAVAGKPGKPGKPNPKAQDALADKLAGMFSKKASGGSKKTPPKAAC